MNYEEIIEKIEDILEEGRPSFAGGGKIKIDGDAIHEQLKQLSTSIPKEIIQARKIVAERREVIRDAQEMANKIIAEAQAKAEAMTQEHEITKAAKDAALKILTEANEQADEIVATANTNAAEREDSAKRWAYEMRKNAHDFAISILEDCGAFISGEIEHYTSSKEKIDLAVSRLDGLRIKSPDDIQ